MTLLAKRPRGKLEPAELVKNHFGLGCDGIKFPDGKVWREDQVEIVPSVMEAGELKDDPQAIKILTTG